MTYSPPSSGFPSPQVLSTMTDDIAKLCAWTTGGGGTAAWPSANAAYFYPVRIDQRRTYTKAWWLNGTAVNGNTDVGIYTIAGTTATRVVASTVEAQAGTSAMQVAATFTETTLNPGIYWLAMSCSLGTASAWRAAPTVNALRSMACFQAAASHPLPSTATVVAITAAFVPVFGFSELASI